jgi:DNA-binding CsgD family transcriptional regulator
LKGASAVVDITLDAELRRGIRRAIDQRVRELRPYISDEPSSYVPRDERAERNAEIRRLYGAGGVTQATLAQRFGLSLATVHDVIARERRESGDSGISAAIERGAPPAPVLTAADPLDPPALERAVAERWRLTQREAQVVARLATTGESDSEIAAALSLSLYTVRHHVKSALGKIGTANRTVLVVRVFRDVAFGFACAGDTAPN